MMIVNIVDRRLRRSRWKCINAIVEAIHHDNNLKDADQAKKDSDWMGYDEREAVSVQTAVDWAHEYPHPVTLFLYDEGDGIKMVEKTDIWKHRGG